MKNTIDRLQTQVDVLNRGNEQIRSDSAEMKVQTNQVCYRVDW